MHFPCGPSLVSYRVANEGGRDVETILIGREGAVVGIVSRRGSNPGPQPGCAAEPVCGGNEAVKGHFEEVLRGSIPTPKGAIEGLPHPKSANQMPNKPLFFGVF
ncbi:hypothetical protein V1294_000819 [Bradyrhizobium sp. AZCC 1678]